MTWRDRETIAGLDRVVTGSPAPAPTPAGPPRGRIAAIDALRGLGLLVMFGSHLSIVSGRFPFPAGWGFGLFVVISGMLWRDRPLGRRYWQLVGAAFVSAPLSQVVGLNAFNVLVAWAVVLPILRLIRSWPHGAIAVAAGIVLVEWWGAGLGGVNPGHLPLFWIAGRATSIDSAARWHRVPTPRWLCALGRRPLAAYLVHLVLLGGLTANGGI